MEPIEVDSLSIVAAAGAEQTRTAVGVESQERRPHEEVVAYLADQEYLAARELQVSVSAWRSVEAATPVADIQSA